MNTASQLAMLPGAVKVGPNGRAEGDFYSTPPDCLRDLLSAWDPDPAPHSILEPAAGAGALLAPLRERWPAATIDAYDIQPRHDAVRQRDVWSGDLSRTWDLVITNPPYSKAREFVEAHWLLAERYLVLLLKLAFFESIERRGWWRQRMPAHVYVLSHRPSFRNGASEPRTAYAWFVWTPRRRVRRTVLEVL